MTSQLKTHITYILSHIDKALAFEWICENLDSTRFQLSFILLNQGESHLENYLQAQGIPVYRIAYRSKKDMPKALFKIRRLLKKEKTQIVHTHLFDASLVGLLAAKLSGIRKRIYTRHHATIHHVYFPRAVYYDKFINSLATDIVAISRNVQAILTQKEKVKAHKVQIIHHGFKLNDFEEVATARTDKLRLQYGIQEQSPVIGIIARQTHWKGIQYIIPAFAQLQKRYPQAHLVLANAQGDYKTAIDQLLSTLPSGSFTEIKFEQDIFALYQLFNLYVHTPIDAHSEAFGQTYIEALAAGIPSVFSLSGVAPEFIESEKNALVVPFQDIEAIFQAFQQLLEDKSLAQQIRKQGKEDVKQLFSLEGMIEKLEVLYTVS